MEEPKISVVIPVYNGAKTLRQCFESVLNQTYLNYDVIVVDNNSTDRTRQVIQEFQTKNSKIKYVYETYRSRGAARNAGINAAGGEIIAMTDCDCIVPKGWLFELTSPIICGDEEVVMGSEKDIVNNYWTKNIQNADRKFLERNLRGGYISHLDTKNFAIKASLMKQLMFNPDIRNLDDWELFLRLKDMTKIKFIPAIEVAHYHRNSFIKVMISSFNRGYWVTKICDKYKTKKANHPMAESISLKNFVLFPFWMAWQFVKKPLGEAFFLLVSEIPWRAGIIWAIIRGSV